MTSTANAAASTSSSSEAGNKPYPFKKIFQVTITPSSIVRSEDKYKCPYVTMKGTLVQRPGKEDQRQTVVAFNNQLKAIEHLLVEGQSVDMAVQWNNGALKILGVPFEKSAPVAEAA